MGIVLLGQNLLASHSDNEAAPTAMATNLWELLTAKRLTRKPPFECPAI